MSLSRRRRQLTSLRFTPNSSVTQSGGCLAVNSLPDNALWDCLWWFLWSFPLYLAFIYHLKQAQHSVLILLVLSHRKCKCVTHWHADCQCSVFVHLWSLTTTKILPPTSMLLWVKLNFFLNHFLSSIGSRIMLFFLLSGLFYGGPESSTHCSLRKQMQTDKSCAN